jgi:hypothetical protein
MISTPASAMPPMISERKRSKKGCSACRRTGRRRGAR